MATSFSYSQDEVRTYDQDNCAKYRSLYFQYLKSGAYRDAMNFWGMAYDYCGGIVADDTDNNQNNFRRRAFQRAEI